MSKLLVCRDTALSLFIWLGVLLIVFWIYFPGLDGPAVLDDSVNLQVLETLEGSPERAMDVVIGNHSGPSGRPVSMLSFALEKLYFDHGIRGQKRTNLIIHLMCGSFLALFFYLLISHRDRYGAAGVAIGLATLWMLSPLSVSTVLYSVQRMAQLSTLFMFASLVSYAVWRTRWLMGNAGWYILLLLPVLIVLAVLSKENGIVIVPVIILLEMLWFQFVGRNGQRNLIFQWVSVAMLTMGIFSLVVFQLLNPDWVVNGYLVRPFTLAERVMTEGRILWDYIFQTIAPEVGRMGVYYDDVIISRSLSDPESTLSAWVAWAIVGITTGVLCFFREGRCYAFAILLFLVGHAIESTVLALELYFEHRNYFPSVGIWLLLGVFITSILRSLPELKNVLLAGIACWAVLLSFQTSSQVQVWSNDILMRLNTINTHPNSPRANINMAVLLAQYGALDDALDYSAKAASVKQDRLGDKDVRDILLSCYANKPLPDPLFRELPLWSAQGRVISATNAFHFLVRKLQNGECSALDAVLISDKFAALFLGEPAQANVTAEVYAALAVLENSLQRYQNAYDYTNLFLALAENNSRGLLMKLHFATALQKGDDAERARAALTALKKSGMLTIGEQQTLSYYEEN